MATAVAPPVTPKTTTSTDPLFQQAVAQAKASLAAQTAPITAEQNASDANFQQQETDATNVGTALSNLLKPIGPAVNDMYQTAGQNQELAAKGFSAGMQDALQGNTDNLNAMLKSFGQPTTLDSHATQAGDVLYGLGGYNPGTAFQKEGAAFGSAAELQSGDAILKGQQNAQALKLKAVQADQGFQAKIAELAGKLPGDVQSNYTKLQQLALSDEKFAHQLAQDKFNNTFKVNQANVKIQEFNARQQMEATKLARTEFQQNRMYAISLAKLGISQRSLQLKVAANAFKAANGGYTPKELNKIQVEAVGLAHSYFSGSSTTKTFAEQSNKTGKGSTSKGPVATQKASISVTKGIGYSDALTKMMSKGIPVQIAIRALNSVYPPDQQLNDAGLANYLGPLAPANIAQTAAVLNEKGGVVLGNAAGYGFNPYTIDTASMKNLSAAGKAAVSGIVSQAQEYLGTPYLWGGESPKGFDCSGLAQYLYAKEGVQIPRTTYEQFQAGLTVPRGQLEAGDLVFFKGSDSKTINGVTLPGHVGIYVGDGKFIEAPYTGSVVRVSNLSGYPGYMGARRYVK